MSSETTFVLSVVIIVLAVVLSLGLRFYQRWKNRLKEQARSEALASLGNEQFKDHDQAQRLKKEKAKAQFDHNLKRHFILRHLRCDDVAIFGEIDWELQPNMNVLLGRNGYGKSYLLRGLTALMQGDDGQESSTEFFEKHVGAGMLHLSMARDREDCEILYQEQRFQASTGKVPLLAIPDGRLINQANEFVAAGTDKYTDLRQYGAYHFLHQLPYESIINTFLFQMCIDHGYGNRSLEAPVFKLISDIVYGLTEQSFRFHSIEPAGNGRFRMEVFVEGESKAPLAIQKASQGTLAVVAMAGIIYYYLKGMFPDAGAEELLNKPATIIIDEIDAHLHPAWQRRLQTLLRKHFPNVQFIITAHSPLVVAGCRDAEVAVLRKAGDQNFTLQQFQHNFIGWEAEDILREVFKVEERDDAYSHYTALLPKKEELKKEVQRLELKSNLSEADEQKLQQHHEDLHYMDKVARQQSDRVNQEDLERENKMLKAEVQKLRSLTGMTNR